MGGAIAEVGGIGVDQGLNIEPHLLVSLDRGIGPHLALLVLIRHQQHGPDTIDGKRLGAGFEEQGKGELVEGCVAQIEIINIEAAGEAVQLVVAAISAL